MRLVPYFLFFLSLAGCADASDPCAPMCAQAAEVYGSCLEEWGTDWAAAGYQDADDFAAGCETWVWELRVLDEDVGGDGVSVDRMCETRHASMPTLSCDEWTDLSWDDSP